MLRDLEARKSPAPSSPGPRLVFQDLSSVPKDPVRRTRSLWIALPALLIVGGASLGIYAWQPWNKTINATTTRSSGLAPEPNATASAATSAPVREEARNNVEPNVLAKTASSSKSKSISANNRESRNSLPKAEPKTVVAATVKKPPSKPIKPSAPVKRQTKVSTLTSAEKPVQRRKTAAIPPVARKIAATGESQAVEKKIRPLTAQERAETAYREALNYLQQGRRTDTENSLKLALGADAAHIKARELLAGVMLQQGHWRDAQDILKQGIAVVPGHYAFVQLLARVQVEHGDESSALALMERSAAQARQDPGYLSFMATLYQRAGRHAEAVKAYRGAIQMSPRQGRWWLGLAISLEAEQNHAAAADAYERAMRNGGLDRTSLRYAQERIAALKAR